MAAYPCAYGQGAPVLRALLITINRLNSTSQFLNILLFSVYNSKWIVALRINFYFVFVLPVYDCILCACSARGDQKRALDALGLELQMIANCHVGAGNETQGL